MVRYRNSVHIIVMLLCFAEILAIDYKETQNKLLGHSRDKLGEIHWGTPPEATYHGSNIDTDIGPWLTTINFAKSIVLDSTRAQSFPYDLLRRIVKDEYSQDEINDYQTNIIVSYSVGGMFISLIALTFVGYVMYRRYQRRRKKYTGQKPAFSGRKLTILMIFGVVTTLIDFIFVICIMMVNTKIDDGIDELDDRVYNSMKDVTKYFEQTHKQYDYMTKDSNIWFGREVLEQDINTLGKLVWQSGSRLFYPVVSPIFKELDNLDKFLTNAATALADLNRKINDVTNGVGRLVKTNLSLVHYNLTFVRPDWTCIGCDGSCPGCHEIVVDDIYPLADFFSLPSLHQPSENMAVLTSEPFKDSIYSPEFYYESGFSTIIHERLQLNITNMLSRLHTFMRIVDNSTSIMKFPDEKSFMFDKLKPNFVKFYDRVRNGNNLRSGFTWFFTVVNLCFNVILIAVLIFVLAIRYKLRRFLMVNQIDQFALSRRILKGSCIGCVVLSVSYIGLAIGGFFIGANLERVVCQTGSDYAIVEKVLDVPSTVPGYPGYFMGEVVLGNGTHELKLSNILRRCEHNLPAYEALRQNQIAPTFNNELNITMQFNDIDDLFDEMYIDFVNKSLVPPLLEPWFDDFKNVATFDVVPFLDLFNKTITKADLDFYISNLRHIANTPVINGGPMNPSKDKLLLAADFLSTLKPKVDELSLKKASIEAVYEEFQNNVITIKKNVAKAITDLYEVNGKFWNESSSLIKQGVDEFRYDFKRVLPEFTDKSSEWLKKNIGMCQPLTDAYKSVLYGFCDKFSDYENAEWLLCGLTAVCLLCITVLMIATINSLIIDTTHNDDINANFEKIFGQSGKPATEMGFLDKVLQRVKQSRPITHYSFQRKKRVPSITPLTVIARSGSPQQARRT